MSRSPEQELLYGYWQGDVDRARGGHESICARLGSRINSPEAEPARRLGQRIEELDQEMAEARRQGQIPIVWERLDTELDQIIKTLSHIRGSINPLAELARLAQDCDD